MAILQRRFPAGQVDNRSLPQTAWDELLPELLVPRANSSPRPRLPDCRAETRPAFVSTSQSVMCRCLHQYFAWKDSSYVLTIPKSPTGAAFIEKFLRKNMQQGKAEGSSSWARLLHHKPWPHRIRTLCNLLAQRCGACVRAVGNVNESCQLRWLTPSLLLAIPLLHHDQ